MEQQVNPWVLIAFNVLLALVSFFGAMWLRRMEREMEELQRSHNEQIQQAAQRELALQSQLRGYVAKEDFREFRDEIRQNFREVFGKIDSVAERLPPKVSA